jgi:hypothetical protein
VTEHLDGHLVPLPGTDWAVWRDAVLRSTGFDVTGLDRFTAPDCARTADEMLAGKGDPDAFDAAFQAAVRHDSRQAYEIAGLPAFATAVTWQNRNAVHAVRGIRRGGPDAPRNNRRREHELAVVRYWQRYTAKNDTIGHFGPVCWATVDPAAPGLTARPGPGLIRHRTVHFEQWAVQALQDHLAADPDIRRWLAPRLQPHLILDTRAGAGPVPDGHAVRPPMGPPIPLTAPEAAVLAACDGLRPAVAVAAAVLSGDPPAGLRGEPDVLVALERLADRGLLAWPAELPMRITAEVVLSSRVAAIPDPAARHRATTALHRLTTARDRVIAAAGDRVPPAGHPKPPPAAPDASAGESIATGAPEALPGGHDGASGDLEALLGDHDGTSGGPEGLLAALEELDGEFTAVTGQGTRRRDGEAYAGRTLCWSDAVRDLELTVGGPVLEAVARPLAVLLVAARWLTAACADAFDKAIREYHDAAVLAAGSPVVPLAELWAAGHELLLGRGERPLDAVTAEFARRMEQLLDLDIAPGRVREVRRDGGVLLERARTVFAADRPGWRAARLHSPDLHLCAPSVAALNAGDFFTVLGELHAGYATVDAGLFVHHHPRPDLLADQLAADLGTPRVHPLWPSDFPRHVARTASCLTADGDVLLGVAPAPGAVPGQTLPIAALTVSDVDGQLRVAAPDGRCWPLVEVFADLLAGYTVDAFKLVGGAPHAPRVWIDRMVVSRERWRCTVTDTGLAASPDARACYLAARRWRDRLGLPDRVYVTLPTEPKPMYADLTSPLHVFSLGRVVRAAFRELGPDAPVSITEPLPAPDHAWVPDAAGRRYHSEIRLQIRDPHPAGELPS